MNDVHYCAGCGRQLIIGKWEIFEYSTTTGLSHWQRYARCKARWWDWRYVHSIFKQEEGGTWRRVYHIG